MHAIHPDRLRVLLAAGALTLIVIFALVTLPRALGDASLSFRGGGDHTAPVAPTTSAAPAWATNPMRSPLAELRR